jgi:hypothetical protein
MGTDFTKYSESSANSNPENTRKSKTVSISTRFFKEILLLFQSHLNYSGSIEAKSSKKGYEKLLYLFFWKKELQSLGYG